MTEKFNRQVEQFYYITPEGEEQSLGCVIYLAPDEFMSVDTCYDSGALGLGSYEIDETRKGAIKGMLNLEFFEHGKDYIFEHMRLLLSEGKSFTMKSKFIDFEDYTGGYFDEEE